MATVRMSFSPSPAHVRTARLVGVVVARHAGVADATLDEVRLAIGEACSRAVSLHRRHDLADLIEVEITDESPFTVRVTDRAPTTATLGTDATAADAAPGAGPVIPADPLRADPLRADPLRADPLGADPVLRSAASTPGVNPSSVLPQTGTGSLDTARIDDLNAINDLDAINEEDVAVGMGLTLLVGLVDEVSVRPAAVGIGTEVEMSWPTGTYQ